MIYNFVFLDCVKSVRTDIPVRVGDIVECLGKPELRVFAIRHVLLENDSPPSLDTYVYLERA